MPESSGSPTAGGLSEIAEDGFLTGVIGGVTVAIFFLIVDIMEGRPFFTPSLLGSIFFQGRDSSEVVSVAAPMVVAYTALHMAAFVAIGLAAAWMVRQFEVRPHLGVVLVLLFACFEAGFLGFSFAFAPGVIGELGGVQVAIANVLSAAAMASYLLWWRHPRALANLDHVFDDETPPGRSPN